MFFCEKKTSCPVARLWQFLYISRETITDPLNVISRIVEFLRNTLIGKLGAINHSIKITAAERPKITHSCKSGMVFFFIHNHIITRVVMILIIPSISWYPVNVEITAQAVSGPQSTFKKSLIAPLLSSMASLHIFRLIHL